MVLEDYRQQCSKLRGLLPEEAAALKGTHDTEMQEMVPKVEGLLVTLRAEVPSAAAARPPVTGAARDPGEPVGERLGAQDSRRGIQMTRLDPPKLDGKARSYLRFKQRFEELVTAHFDSMAQLEYYQTRSRRSLPWCRKHPDRCGTSSIPSSLIRRWS